MPTIRKQTETDIVRGCLELLALRGLFAWRNNTTGVFDPTTKRFRKFTGKKGVSDILGIIGPGRLLAVECKRPGQYPTPEQRAFLAEVNANGGLGVVVRSVGELEAIISSVK